MMMSDRVSEQLFLPGQAAAPDGPVDLTMMWVMHHGFRRDLAAFSTAAARTPVKDRATWRALRKRWQQFATILHSHHSGEDAGLWPLLLQRADAAGDTAARKTLEAMQAEHADIDPLLESVAEGFSRLTASPDEDARAALEVRLVAAREQLGRHLAHEERDAMAILQQYLVQQDWDRVEKKHFQPKNLRYLLFTVSWALYRLPEQGVQRALDVRGGPMIAAVWQLLLRGPFARRERKAFRHA